MSLRKAFRGFNPPFIRGIHFPYSRVRVWLSIFFTLVGAFLWRAENTQWFWGGFCQALSFLVAISAFPVFPKLKTPTNRSLSSKKVVNKKTSAKPSYRFLAVLLACMFLAEWFFHDQVLRGGLLFLGASAFLVWRKNLARTVPMSFGTSLRPEWLLGLLVLMAALIRFPFLSQNFTGFQIDEANDLNAAYDMIHNHDASPFATGWWGRATFEFSLLADGLRIFGASLAGGRAFSSLLSLALLVIFYKWTRLYFNSAACLTATFLMSVSWWFLWGSFVTFPMMVQDLGMVSSFYFLDKALREKKTGFYWWSGAVSGMTLMTYVWGRCVPFLVAAWGGVIHFACLSEQRLRSNGFCQSASG